MTRFGPDILVAIASRAARVGLVIAIASCGAGPGVPPAHPDAGSPDGGDGVEVSLGSCPDQRESPAGKVRHEAFLRADPGTTRLVAVKLREILPAIPPCADPAPDARCEERDRALEQRRRLNQQQITCVAREIGGDRASINGALWYELPQHLTSGRPVPIGLAFTFQAIWPQVEALAAHPFVEAIEPPPGEVLGTGASPPAPPAGCPAAREEPLRKLTRAESIKGGGRAPVVVELRDEGLLPPVVSCPDGTLCEAAIVAQWDRAILNKRHHTCVARWIDAQVKAPSPKVPFAAITGSPLTPPLPPFGEIPKTIKAFGQGLTWEEAVEVARHPYVESIWTASGVQFEPPPAPGCPPDLGQPVPTRTCPTARESAGGKISAEDMRKLAQTTGPQRMDVGVRGGARICPLPECPSGQRTCSARDSYADRWQAENAEAQRCVRQLITAIGGRADAEVFWIVNHFFADLTWDQIQQVATHPDVENIQPSGDGTPPP